MGGQACAQHWVLWVLGFEPVVGGSPDGRGSRTPICGAAPRTRSGARAPPLARILGSSGFRAGRAQRAPDPGDVKLAAGKKELHPSIPSAVGPHSLPAWLPGYEGPQPWGSVWALRYLLVAPPTGREAAPETSPEVGQGRQRVNGHVARVHWTRAACLGF